MVKEKKEPTEHIVTISQAELTVRLVEAITEAPRPAGVQDPDELLGMLSEEIRGPALRAARAAMEYMIEALQEGIPSSHLRTTRSDHH